MKNWTPAAEGVGFELTPTLEPLAPFRRPDDWCSAGSTACRRLARRAGDGVHATGQHALPDRRVADRPSETRARRRHLDGPDSREASSASTRSSPRSSWPSSPARSAGACDVGLQLRLHQHDLAGGAPTTPLPMENNPRAVFERLFGDSGSTDPTARLARIQQDRSILDSVTARGRAPAADRSGRAIARKLDEYLDAIRDVERRIQKAEEQSDQELPLRRAARRHPGHLRRAREADVRPAGAGLSDRPDARHHVHDGPRVQRPDVSADRRARCAPSDLASSERGGEDREAREDQPATT